MYIILSLHIYNIPPCVHPSISIFHHVYIPPYLYSTMYISLHIYIPPCIYPSISIFHHVYVPPNPYSTVYISLQIYIPPCIDSYISMFLCFSMFYPTYVSRCMCLSRCSIQPMSHDVSVSLNVLSNLCLTMSLFLSMFYPTYVSRCMCFSQCSIQLMSHDVSVSLNVLSNLCLAMYVFLSMFHPTCAPRCLCFCQCMFRLIDCSPCLWAAMSMIHRLYIPKTHHTARKETSKQNVWNNIKKNPNPTTTKQMKTWVLTNANGRKKKEGTFE